MTSYGSHYLATYELCNENIRNIPSLRDCFLECCEKSGLHVLNTVSHAFPTNDGFTMVVLLSESHASLHTYPEDGCCFVDVFTCNKSYEEGWAIFHKHLCTFLGSSLCTVKMLERTADYISESPRGV
jgi:S-adenosylmethionine/arginine decarboxylase-like enzyme